jgi:hypothetical protein
MRCGHPEKIAQQLSGGYKEARIYYIWACIFQL